MSEQIIRAARADDADAVAEVWLRARARASIPQAAHSDGEVRDWIRGQLVPSGGVWVAEVGGEVVAMIALEGDWVEQLYVAPEHQGRGHGSRLLELAKERQRELSLWVFESNVAAQRFYEARGFTRFGPVSSDNEEQAPAVRYRWRAA